MPASSLLLIAILTLVWGCNWPVLKLGVDRARAADLSRDDAVVRGASGCSSLPSLLGRFDSHSARLWGKRRRARAVQHRRVERTDPVRRAADAGGTLGDSRLHDADLERCCSALAAARAAVAAQARRPRCSECAAWSCCSATTLHSVQRAPIGALFILGAAIIVGIRHRAAAPLEAADAAEHADRMDDAPRLDSDRDAARRCSIRIRCTRWRRMSGTAWFAVLYNIFLAGTLAHWAWFKMARTLPVAVSSLSSLPVPVVGVLSGMLFLGERPGSSEFIALALVLASLAAVLFAPERRSAAPSTAAAPPSAP